MIFKRVSDKEIADMNRYLLNCMSQSMLEKAIDEIGLTSIEKEITLLRYGKARLTVEELCKQLNISPETYKKHRRNILYKISIFFSNQHFEV